MTAIATPEPASANPSRAVSPAPHAPIGFQIVRISLSLLLLVAAVSKIYGQSVDMVAQVGVFSAPWFQTSVIKFELIMGLWLVSGKWLAGAWLGVILTFTAFAGFSFYAGWIGQTSCDCFGAIHASPWWAFGIDIGVLVLLALARPALGGLWSMSQGEKRSLLSLASGVALCLLVLWTLASLSFGSVDGALAHLRGERISVVPSSSDLGSAKEGEIREAHVELINRTEHPIRIVGSKDDCSCSTITVLPMTIPPKGSRSITVAIRFEGAPGLFTRKATLYAEDEGLKRVSLRLTGRTLNPSGEVEGTGKSPGK